VLPQPEGGAGAHPQHHDGGEREEDDRGLPLSIAPANEPDHEPDSAQGGVYQSHVDAHRWVHQRGVHRRRWREHLGHA
jgi:hypothetical protein